MVEAAPSNQGRPTGKYSLQAVLTHKGRSADSGHYVSWVKQADGKWVEFDDDNLILREVADPHFCLRHRFKCKFAFTLFDLLTVMDITRLTIS
jgi:hypothetical protein